MALDLIVARKQGSAWLMPVTAHDDELISGLTVGKEYQARLTRPRSLRAQRFYWGLLQKCVDNHAFYRSAEALHVWIKKTLGMIDEVTFHDGEVFVRLKSTAFGEMDDFEWRPFMDSALDLIVIEILPGVSKRDLIREIEAMLGLSYDRAFPVKARGN